MIDWTDEAIDAALQELHGTDWRGVSEKMNAEAVAEIRAALNAAVKAQGNGSFSLTTFLAYEAGRNGALEEAAKIIAQAAAMEEAGYGHDLMKLTDAIRTLKGEDAVIYAWLSGATFMLALEGGSEGKYREAALDIILSALLAYAALKGETP